jgi:hypothetical protein
MGDGPMTARERFGPALANFLALHRAATPDELRAAFLAQPASVQEAVLAGALRRLEIGYVDDFGGFADQGDR